MSLTLIVPKKEDLTYRKQIVEDSKTMEYNHGIVPFPKEKWDSWYDKWIGNNDPNFFYAYLFDGDREEYVGEIAYRKDPESDGVILNIIIEHKHRGYGYGKEGLKELVKMAFKNGYTEVRDLIAGDNYGSQKIFKNFGFNLAGYDSDGCADFRMTKDEFIKRYGEID